MLKGGVGSVAWLRGSYLAGSRPGKLPAPGDLGYPCQPSADRQGQPKASWWPSDVLSPQVHPAGPGPGAASSPREKNGSLYLP